MPMAATKRDFYEVLGVGREAPPTISRKPIARWRSSFIRTAIRVTKRRPRNSRKRRKRTRSSRIRRSASGTTVTGMPGLNGTAFHDFRSTDDIMSAFSDIFGGGLFGDLFGERRRGPRPGPDLLMKLEIELVEAARGTSRTIEVSRQEFCGECRGSGARKGTSPTTCNYCGGRGQIVQARGFLSGGDHLPGLRRRRRSDHRSVPQLPRRGPSSQHALTSRSTFRPGVESGMWLQLRNQGELGDVGGQRGNLRIQIVVKKHPFFERRRNDLICQVPISFAQAALGAVVEVPTLDGPEDLEVPRGHAERRDPADSRGGACRTSAAGLAATSWWKWSSRRRGI